MRRKGIVPSVHLNKFDGISWPILVVLLIVLICQPLADGTSKFSQGVGQNEVAQMRTFGGGEAANSGVASSVASNWEGSGAIPDDEDGDVDEEGSGDGPSAEGSGSAPADEFGRRTPNESVAITDTRSPAQFGDSDRRKQYANTTTTVIHLHSLSPISVLSTTRATPPTVATTTTTIMLATTLRPPLMKPAATTARTTTALSSSVSSRSSSKMATTTVPRMVKPKDEDKWPQPQPKSTAPPFVPTRTTKRPFFISDPSGTLEQLRPGIFAFIVGGVVVGLLLLILIISYLVYRLKKRDEGTYICDEPHQQSHYPYAYKKASIREFYA
ncbi:hypothetical protein niasHT_025889 [Heterodera trifolii]|uniref:Syndecan/Neurexin domain-containing protein n=1 Tax=Heterodera trifolii TaxID=157864 RepID=A0ABD2JUX9_9BILA